MEGWIQAHRKMLDCPELRDPFALAVWVHLLLRAQHRPARLPYHGISIDVGRGELVISLRDLVRTTEVPLQRLRTIIARFTASGMLIANTVSNTAGNTVCSRLTICNYDAYQALSFGANTASKQEASQVQHTEQEGKNLKTPNVESNSNRIPDSAPAKPTPRGRKEYPAEFGQLWSTYPRREEDDKAECFKHWQAVTKSVEPSALLVAATAYHAEHHDNEFRFGLRRWLSKHLYRNPVPKRRQTQEEDVIGAAHRMSMDVIQKMKANGHGYSEEFAGTHSLVPDGPPPGVWSWPEDDGGAPELAERPIHRSLIGPPAGNA
jgi:hypothetical protein